MFYLYSPTIYSKKLYFSKFMKNRKKIKSHFDYLLQKDSKYRQLCTIYEQNSDSFKLIYDRYSKPIGHWIIIPISLRTYKRFIEGKLGIEQLLAKHITEWPKNNSQAYLFIYDVKIYEDETVYVDNTLNCALLDIINFLIEFDGEIPINGLCSYSIDKEYQKFLQKCQFKKSNCQIQNEIKDGEIYYYEDNDNNPLDRAILSEMETMLINTKDEIIPEWKDINRIAFFSEIFRRR